MRVEITVKEMDRIFDVIDEVWDDIYERCQSKGLDKFETLSALGMIHEYLQSIESDLDGIHDSRKLKKGSAK